MSDPRAWTAFAGSQDTASGVKVSEETLLGLPGVFAAVRNVSEDLASVAYVVAEKRDGIYSTISHPVSDVLAAPNPWMTGFEFFESLIGQMELRGNAYAEIAWESGKPVALWPLRSDMVYPYLSTGGELYYRVSFGGRLISGSSLDQVLPAYRVLHLRRWGPNGFIGYDPVVAHKEVFGRGSAALQYGARFFGNGSRPGGILTTDSELTQESADRMRQSWEEAHSGLTQAHRVAVLEMGVTWKTVGLGPEAAQYIETEKLSLRDAARIWRVPPHMIGDLESATYSNISQQSREYVKFSLLPRARRIEDRLGLSLLGRTSPNLRVRLLIDSLLRGDIEARYKAYSVGRNWGWLSVNEIREQEGMVRIDGGDRYLEPVNMLEAGTDGKGTTDQPDPVAM